MWICKLRRTDDYIAENEAPERPSWCRAFTDLPAATIGQNYSHTLREGRDFYDENNEISSVSALRDGFFSSVPSWLTIAENPNRAGDWILSGVPTNPSAETISFALSATNVNNFSGTRGVEIEVNGADGEVEFTPILPGGGYAGWVESVTASNPDVQNTGVSEDFDGDGIANLLEYVLLSNPAVDQPNSPLPEVLISESANEYVFSYTRGVSSLVDTEQFFLYSTDLETWESINLTGIIGSEVEIQDLGNGSQEVEVLLESTNLAEDGRIFGQLEVILSE